MQADAVSRFLLEAQIEGRKKSSIQRLGAVLRSFAKFLQYDGQTDKVPRLAPLPSREEKLPEILNENEIQRIINACEDGTALGKFAEFIAAQGGDSRAVYDSSLLPEAPVKLEVPSTVAGYVQRINAQGVGLVSMHLGGGRETAESNIDLAVGVVLHKKRGDAVAEGESIATIHARDEKSAEAAIKLLRDAYTIGAERPEPVPFVKAIIRAEDDK